VFQAKPSILGVENKVLACNEAEIFLSDVREDGGGPRVEHGRITGTEVKGNLGRGFLKGNG